MSSLQKSWQTFRRLKVYQSSSPPPAPTSYSRIECYSYDERAEGHTVGASPGFAMRQPGISSFQRASLDSRAYDSAYSSIPPEPQDVHTMSEVASCLSALVEFFRVPALSMGPGKCPRSWRNRGAPIGGWSTPPAPPTPLREGVLPFGDSLLNFDEDLLDNAEPSPDIGEDRSTRATSSSHPSSSSSLFARSSEIPREFGGEIGPSTLPMAKVRMRLEKFGPPWPGTTIVGSRSHSSLGGDHTSLIGSAL